jgi:hypothetical protein
MVFSVPTRKHAAWGFRQIPRFFRKHILRQSLPPDELYQVRALAFCLREAFADSRGSCRWTKVCARRTHPRPLVTEPLPTASSIVVRPHFSLYSYNERCTAICCARRAMFRLVQMKTEDHEVARLAASAHV